MANIAIFRINYKSDFILTLNSDAGWLTPFCIKFWTDAPSQAYFASFDGTTYTHCAPVEGEPTKLVVQFDDHHLPIGDLKFQIGYHFTVADFPTSVEDEVLNQASVIIEVDGEPAQVMLDLNGETAPEIEFSLPAYANEAQRIANEEQRIAAETQRIANEETRISAEQVRQQNETQRISREQARQTNETQRIEREQIRQEHEAQRIANETERVTEFAEIKTEAVAATNAANAAASLANEKAEYAQTQGNYAKAQGDTALADHERAAADHTQAEQDHTRAESDHTRAESDHTAVEVYVDSLGAFDISAYHATGGVLAKYADLTAALGTNGANIPDALRKGGMSVKFVQSSDNKYVEYRLMHTLANASTAAADFANTDNWQSMNVDDEPTAGSENLVKSGGVGEILFGSEQQEIVPSEVVSETCYIASDGTWLVNNPNQTGKYFPVEGGRTITIAANSTDNLIYAFIKEPPVNNTVPIYATGETKTFINAGTSVIRTIPNDAVYMWFAIKSYAHDFTPQSITIEGTDGIAQRLLSIENDVEEIKEQLPKNTATKLPFENGSIGEDGFNSPAKKESNFFRCFRTGNYFSASKLYYTPANDEEATVYTYRGDKTFIEKKTLTGDFTPDADVVFMKVQIIYCDTTNVANINISQGGLDNNGDEESSTNWVRTGYIDIDNPGFDSVWYIGKLKGRIYDASHNILNMDSSFARFQNLYGGLSKFRDFLDILYSATFFPILANAKYIRLAFATNPETSITPSTYDVRFTSGDVARHTPTISAENYQEEFNGYISPSTLSFAFKFSAGANGQQVSQSEAATALPLYDNGDYMSSGVLLLPPNYSEKGKPVPLILYIHGSGDYEYLGCDVASQYYMDYLSYWQKEGFAVADFFARTSKYGAIGGDVNGMPTNLASYEQGYKWLIDHYNIDRSGCFVTGKSMGGVGALMICYSKSIPVKAADILAPALNPFYQQCGYGILSRQDYITDFRLDNADALIENASPAAPMSQDDFNALMIANKDKLVGYNAYLSKVTNMTWEELVPIKYKNPNTFNNVVKLCEVPFRIHIAEDDSTVAYHQSLNLIKAMKNSGSIAEIRTMPANTGQHHAVDNSPNALKVASIVTRLGYTCTDVPLAYVEAVSWFRYYK